MAVEHTIHDISLIGGTEAHMKKNSAIGYTCDPLQTVIDTYMLDSYPGVTVHLCSKQWKKCMCKDGHCELFLLKGSDNVKRQLARIFKKSINKLTWHDLNVRANMLTQAAYKQCRPVVVSVTEQV